MMHNMNLLDDTQSMKQLEKGLTNMVDNVYRTTQSTKLKAKLTGDDNSTTRQTMIKSYI